jgi:hypothetical protein
VITVEKREDPSSLEPKPESKPKPKPKPNPPSPRSLGQTRPSGGRASPNLGEPRRWLKFRLRTTRASEPPTRLTTVHGAFRTLPEGVGRGYGAPSPKETRGGKLKRLRLVCV